MQALGRYQQGVMMVLAPVLFLVLMLFMALLIDGTYVRASSVEMQQVADTSALAGAANVENDTALAEQAAWEYAEVNMTDLQSGDVVVQTGHWDGAAFNAAAVPTNAVSVSITRDVPLFFTALTELAQFHHTATAIAVHDTSTGTHLVK